MKTETSGFTYYLVSDGFGKPPFGLARMKSSPPDVDQWTPEGWVAADWLHEYIANMGSDAASQEVTSEEGQEWASKNGPKTPTAVEALSEKVKPEATAPAAKLVKKTAISPPKA